MAARAWLFALILGIPALGVVVSTELRSRLDADLRAAVLAQSPAAAPAWIATQTIAGLCRSNPDRVQEFCDEARQLTVLNTASWITGATGLGLLALIAVAGSFARSSRNALLSLFQPGLNVTAVAIAGLIVAHAAIAIAIMYYGTHRLNLIAVAIAVGAFAGVAAVGRSAFALAQKAETFAIGKPVSAAEAPTLWSRIETVADRLGALRPDHIVVGLDPTFYVTEANVTTPDGPLTGRTLFCSLPLARILTVPEFTAIVGHQLGHFRGDDTQFSERFYPIYRGSATAIVALQTAGRGGWRAIAVLPAIAVFSFFLERFSVAVNHHSRIRELLADQAGADATSAQTMATALVKVHAFGGVWGDFQAASVQALQQNQMVANAGAVFTAAVARRATPHALDGIADAHTSHPTDSHPPLGARLLSLDVTLPSVADAALSVNPAESAATLIDNVDAQEEALSRTYQLLLARQLGIELTSRSGPRSSLIQRCVSCGTRVLPKPDGHCPSCGAVM